MRILIMLSVLICYANGFAQQIGFFKETIIIHVDEEYTSVNGVYYFSRDNAGSNRSFTIFYPMPMQLDSNVFIEAFNMDDNSLLPITRKNNGVSFRCIFSTSDTVMININYRYLHNGSEMQYILSSTKEWKKPLSEADYLFYLNKKFLLKSISYKQDTIYNQKDYLLYHLHKENFMPDKDFTVRFELKPPPK